MSLSPPYDVLVPWLKSHPGLSDADALAALHAPTVAVVRRVPLADLERYAHDSGVYGRLLARSEDTDPAHSTARLAAVEMLDLFRAGRMESVDTQSQAFAAKAAALAVLGDVTPADLAAVDAMVTQQISQADEWGVTLALGNLASARQLIAGGA